MLTIRKIYVPTGRGELPQNQRGVVLLLTLIVLVVLTLGAISLMRSVDTTNAISGNLAFRQSSVFSGAKATEQAIDWLEGAAQKDNDSWADGYSATYQQPNAGETWDGWWQRYVIGCSSSCDSGGAPTSNGKGYFTVTDPTTNKKVDAAGNTVSYHIDRMCTQVGVDPDPNHCAEASIYVDSNNNSVTAGTRTLRSLRQYFYRITTRVAGPRGTVSYTQTMVAL